MQCIVFNRESSGKCTGKSHLKKKKEGLGQCKDIAGQLYVIENAQILTAMERYICFLV